MDYSLTHHTDHKRVYFYSLKLSVRLALDVQLTGAILARLEQALRVELAK